MPLYITAWMFVKGHDLELVHYHDGLSPSAVKTQIQPKPAPKSSKQASLKADPRGEVKIPERFDPDDLNMLFGDQEDQQICEDIFN